MNSGNVQKTRKQKSEIQFTQKNKRKFSRGKNGFGFTAKEKEREKKKSEASLGDREGGYDGGELFLFYFFSRD